MSRYGCAVAGAETAFSGVSSASALPASSRMDPGQPKFAEALQEPCGAGALPKRRGGNASERQLPGEDLRPMQMNPMKGSMDRDEGGQMRDAVLCRHRGPNRGAGQYSTSTRKSPFAGAVGPAADRRRWARIAGSASGSRQPAPACASVPTRLRTILCRKPEPVIR